MRSFLNLLFDRLVRPELCLFGRTWPAYGMFVHASIFLATAFSLLQAWLLGLSLPLMAAVTIVGISVAVGMAFATKRLLHQESYVWLHYQILILLAGTLFLSILGEPPLAYLDVLMATLLLALAIGRIGCLMAGCCHGRPQAWGVRYTHRHAATGFPREFVGVRLFPMQAVECLILFALVTIAAVRLTGGAEPGLNLSFLLVAYAAFRFGLEFARGDTDRRFSGGFSEAQWTSLAILLTVPLLGLLDLLPSPPWQTAATSIAVLTTVVVAWHRRRFPSEHSIFHPRHIAEVAEFLAVLPPPSSETTQQDPSCEGVHIGTTSAGLNLSVSQLEGPSGAIPYFCISGARDPLSDSCANAVKRLILRLTGLNGHAELVSGRYGIFHVLIHPMFPPDSSPPD